MPGAVDGDLRSAFRRRLPGHWQSVESASTAQGIPDSNYCIRGCEGWVEFKQTHTWRVKFKTTQPGWIIARTQAGGRVWIGIRRWRVESDPGVDDLWLVPGRLVVQLATMGLQSVPHCIMGSRGARRWDWSLVERMLVSQVESPPLELT